MSDDKGYRQRLEENYLRIEEENECLQSENKRYKEALEFYSNFYNYNYGGDSEAMKQVGRSVITEDSGEVARKSLSGE